MPNEAMRQGLVRVEGKMYPVTLVGRWIERSEGRDDAELERERAPVGRSRAVARRGARSPTAPAPGQGDPRRASRGRRKSGQLMSYEDLYALWERQNWRAHEIDFTRGQAALAGDAGESASSTRCGRLRASTSARSASRPTSRPSCSPRRRGEVEIFLATQLVDEARHAAFFDRFMAEVMALEGEDISGRLRRDRAADAAGVAHGVRRSPARHRAAAAGASPTTWTCSWRASSPTTS